jgi:CO/xanthine dehydrogenase FAD-binding subunit
MTRQRQLEQDERVVVGWPILVEATRLIGHVQIRNRGTVGGSLSHHDPAAELPAVMTALGAELVLESHARRRVVSPADFFLDYLTTCLDPNELLTEVRVPALPPKTGTAFLEISRRHGDFALAGAATLVSLDDSGHVKRASIVLLGVAGAPIVCEGADRPLIGRPVTEETARDAAAVATGDLNPPSDIHATSEYRREVAGVLVRRALLAASRRARGEAA